MCICSLGTYYIYNAQSVGLTKKDIQCFENIEYLFSL